MLGWLLIFPRCQLGRLLIDALVPDIAFDGVRVIYKQTFDVFKVEQPRAISELVNHPRRQVIGLLLDRGEGIFAVNGIFRI